MRDSGHLVHVLRNAPVRQLIAALKRDGFVLRRTTRTGGRIYSHADGRLTVIHYHRSNDTLPRGTLRSFLAATRWTDEDLKRLGLL